MIMSLRLLKVNLASKIYSSYKHKVFIFEEANHTEKSVFFQELKVNSAIYIYVHIT